MLYFLAQGYRVIAHDRRGHGRSSQTSTGHDMNTYADDVAVLHGEDDQIVPVNDTGRKTARLVRGAKAIWGKRPPRRQHRFAAGSLPGRSAE
jgi:alpha-beta hydrolase superfamily lysophospholipase